jgi:hypothetical protein
VLENGSVTWIAHQVCIHQRYRSEPTWAVPIAYQSPLLNEPRIRAAEARIASQRCAMVSDGYGEMRAGRTQRVTETFGVLANAQLDVLDAGGAPSSS